MSKSSTIIESDMLDEIHPGDLVRTEFVEPLGLDARELAAATGIAEATLRAFLNGLTPVTANLDLRLGRYFRMSAGFFLRLQIDYEMRLWRRAHAAELERIIPRAA